jgi:hypothetical protein
VAHCISAAPSCKDKFSLKHHQRAARIAVIYRFANSPFSEMIFDPDRAPLLNFTCLLDVSLRVSFFASIPLKVLGINVTV